MKTVRQSMIVSIVVNTILVFIKLIIGMISNYKSLIADAIHSFSDLLTDVVAIFGQWLAIKKADNKHPYGHGKMEYVTSLVIGLFIMTMGISLLSAAVGSEIVETHHRFIALIAVAITIILKFALARYIFKKGKQANNNILIASSQENMSDVLSASSVFIAIVLSFFQDSISFLKYADKVSGIVISLLIIKTSYNIFKENITAIIGECEHDENVIAKIKDKIMSVSNVLIIDNLTVMKYGSYYQVVLDVGVDEEYKLKDAHNIAHDIEKQLLDGDLNIKYVVVHVNPYRKVSVED